MAGLTRVDDEAHACRLVCICRTSEVVAVAGRKSTQLECGALDFGATIYSNIYIYFDSFFRLRLPGRLAQLVRAWC